MTDQQEYNVFMAKLGDKIREIREDYSKLSVVNQGGLNNCAKLFLRQMA